MNSAGCRLAVLIAILFTMSAGLLHAQTAVTGAITGTLTDSSGAAVAQADVEATNTGTGVITKTVTNDTGAYHFPSLIPGTYTVAVKKSNFQTVERQKVEITAGTIVRIDATMNVGSVSTSVDVSSEAPILQTDSAEVSQTVQSKQIQELPSFGRNVTRLSLLAPGVSMDSGQLDVHPENAGEDFNVNVNGASPNNNSHLLDGVENTEGIQGFSMLVTSQDSVSEVKLTTSNYDAEYGRVGGGVWQITTKSGSNKLHGSAFEYYRSAGFNAANPFTEPNGPAGNVWNQFGGSLGGAIKKDKLFFFGDYQGMRNHLATSSLYTTPIDAFRNGDFSSIAATNPIYDPQTGAADGTGRTPFAGNIIPADRISAAAKNLLALLPEPNFGAPGQADNNFVISRPGIFNQNQTNGRLDYYLTPKTVIFGKYSYFQSKFFTDNVFGAVAGGPALGGIPNSGDSGTHTNSFMVDYQHTFSPSLLHDFRFSFSRLIITELQLDASSATADQVGIPNINTGTIYTTGLPEFDLEGPTSSFSMGDFGLPFFEHETNFQFYDNWTKTSGHHSVKFGADVSKFFGIRSDTSGRGTFHFGQSTTELNKANLSPTDPTIAGGLGLASFLLGAPNNYARRITLVQPQEKQWKIGVYGQDTWQVTPRLNLLLGLRWDYATPIFAPEGESVGNLDLNTGNVLLSNLYDKYAGVHTLKTEFSPRLGFSYRLMSSTVLRGGFGRSYFLNPYGASFGTQACCWPIKQDQTFNPANSFAPLAFNLDQGPGVPATLPAFPKSGQIPLTDGLSEIFPGVGDYAHSYSDMWNLTLQHTLPYEVKVEIGYVGNVGRKLWYNHDVNLAVPGTGDFNERQPYFNKFGWTQGLTLRDNRLSSNYHSLQARVEKRFGGGLWVLSNFSWSHTLDYGVFGVQNPFDIASNYGPEGRPLSSVTAVTWEIPFGNHLTGASRALLGGWNLSTIVNLESGKYFTPTWGDNSGFSSPVTLRPDRIGSGKVSHPTRDLWFDPTAFTQPAPLTYGNSGRNILMAPGFAETDLSLSKGFRITEGSSLKLQLDAFNAFNRTNLGGPDSTVTDSTAGQITSMVEFKRRLQIGAHFNF